jgi:hypothetical protein
MLLGTGRLCMNPELVPGALQEDQKPVDHREGSEQRGYTREKKR